VRIQVGVRIILVGQVDALGFLMLRGEKSRFFLETDSHITQLHRKAEEKRRRVGRNFSKVERLCVRVRERTSET